MGLLTWIVLGLIAGWLAGLIMRGRGYGVIGDIIMGILGAVLGGFLASFLFKIPDPVNGINLSSVLVAFIGAVVLILILRALPGRTNV
jgi:uncharacterized membrane protein YeaQ/YmgE (transglycosylase-associated protein family)